MDNEKKIACSDSDFNDFMSNLRNKYEKKLSEYTKSLDFELHIEIQKWFDGHYISDSKS